MRRGVMVAVVGVLLLCAGLAAYRQARPPAAANVVLTFLHYTNDFRGIRSQMYKLPDDSDKSMAVFRIEITDPNRNLGWSDGQILLYLSNGWSPDVNHSLPRHSIHVPKQTGQDYDTLIVPVPAGTNAWRYSILCIDNFFRPDWQQKAIKFLNQAGFNMLNPVIKSRGAHREFTITSPEITR